MDHNTPPPAATPGPGPRPRSPINFLGVLNASALAQLDSRLAEARSALLAAGCHTTPLLTYSHYPCATVAGTRGGLVWVRLHQCNNSAPNTSWHPCLRQARSWHRVHLPRPHHTIRAAPFTSHAPTTHSGQPPSRPQCSLTSHMHILRAVPPSSPPPPAPAGSGGLSSQDAPLPQLLARHDVSMHVNGHLHRLFGERLHSVTRKPNGANLAECEGGARGWGGG